MIQKNLKTSDTLNTAIVYTENRTFYYIFPFVLKKFLKKCIGTY